MPAGSDNWDDHSYKKPLGADAARNYTQYYTYDAVGNILSLQHSAGVGSYTRSYGYGTSNNRLVSTEVGGTVYTYDHDGRGNMVQMPHLQAGWGMANQMTDAQVADVTTFYQYSSGERARKYTDKGSVKEERIYLGNYEIYRKYDGSGNIDLERATVHVSDGTGRIAMLERRTQGDDEGPEELTRYIYSNHLQSATLELDEQGHVISYEEYHPYGTTAFQAMNADLKATAKRYRFAGKERDEESGLYYHGARYYAPWLGRWTAADPLEAEYTPLSSYNYCFNNPVTYTDPTGMGPDDPQKMPEVTLDEVNVYAKRKEVSTADNATIWRMNPAKIEGAKERMAQQRRYDNQEILMADSYGNSYAGPRKDVTARVGAVNRERQNQVADNILGGFFGAFGYWVGGEPGAAIGAGVDQAAAAGVALGAAKTRMQQNQGSVSNRSAPKNVPFDPKAAITELHHGTNLENAAIIRKEGINILGGRAGTDFGRGFYMTTNIAEAISSAERKYGNNIEIVSYKVPIMELDKLNSLSFPEANEGWRQFIHFNRGRVSRNFIGHNFDLVYGPLWGRENSAGVHLPYVIKGQTRFQTSIHSQRAADLFNRSIQKSP